MNHPLEDMIALGKSLLEREHGAEFLDWARNAYLFDLDDTTPLVLEFCCGAEVPPPAKVLLFEIMQGDRKPKKKRRVNLKYEPLDGWIVGLAYVGLSRLHKAIAVAVAEAEKQDTESLADKLSTEQEDVIQALSSALKFHGFDSIEPKDVIQAMSSALEFHRDSSMKQLDIGITQFKKLVKEIGERLDRLPNL